MLNGGIMPGLTSHTDPLWLLKTLKILRAASSGLNKKKMIRKIFSNKTSVESAVQLGPKLQSSAKVLAQSEHYIYCGILHPHTQVLGIVGDQDLVYRLL